MTVGWDSLEKRLRNWLVESGWCLKELSKGAVSIEEEPVRKHTGLNREGCVFAKAPIRTRF